MGRENQNGDAASVYGNVTGNQSLSVALERLLKPTVLVLKVLVSSGGI